MWHRLSGQPDNVTDDGEVILVNEGQRLSSEKRMLRAAMARLSDRELPSEVRSLARLAAGYLVAGDVETARRYIDAAHERLSRNCGARG